MQRNLKQFEEQLFDVAIIGGGIYGAALAREAATRGLSTALIEKNDFCSATSANSLKIIHGGLRYLQQADIIRIRESVRERRAMLCMAPNLISPMPCFMPTTGVLKSKSAMRVALLINDILSADRNRGIIEGKHIGRGKVVSRVMLEELMNGHSVIGNGAAIWTDAIADDTERVVIEMLRSAVESGACVANYLAFSDFIRSDSTITGIRARDGVDGCDVEIQSRLVINAAGPWVNRILEKLSAEVRPLNYALALGMNAVLNRKLLPTHAAGLPCREPGPDKGRLMFFAPWQDTTMAGTSYRHYDESIDEMNPTEADVERLIGQLNSALPTAEISRDDIGRIHAGLLPCASGTKASGDPQLLLHYRLVDHSKRDKVDGLISVLGVKYTTARDVAQRTINLSAAKLGRRLRPSTTAFTPLSVAGELFQKSSSVSTRVTQAVESEMAQSLADVIYRRSGYGAKGAPDAETLQLCATVAAKVLGWNRHETKRQIEMATRPPFGFGHTRI